MAIACQHGGNGILESASLSHALEPQRRISLVSGSSWAVAVSSPHGYQMTSAEVMTGSRSSHGQQQALLEGKVSPWHHGIMHNCCGMSHTRHVKVPVPCFT